MTILGFRVASPSCAVAWCDSETYVDDAPGGEICKLAIGALAGIMGAGTGTVDMILDAGEVVQRSPTLEDVVASLPFVLRDAQRQALQTHGARPWASGSAYAVVGRCAHFGRVVGYVFRAADDFAPLLTSRFAYPEIGMADRMVADEQGVVSAALQQIATLRRTLPAATGRTLMMAELHGRRVMARPVFDLATAWRSLPEPPVGVGGRMLVSDGAEVCD